MNIPADWMDCAPDTAHSAPHFTHTTIWNDPRGDGAQFLPTCKLTTYTATLTATEQMEGRIFFSHFIN